VSLTILFVCTGNVCRSPMAEYVARRRVAETADLRVFSAGVAALVGDPVDAGSASALAELGIDSSAHRARQFDPWEAGDVDLVLTAEVAHREVVMAQVPGALRRTFTMKEFARLLPHVGQGTPAELIDRAAQIRGMYGAVPRALDDVPDPYRRGLARAQATLGEITTALEPLLAAFALEGPAPTRRSRPAPGPRRPLPKRSPA
jgi:protein-tyrosine phosphatase